MTETVDEEASPWNDAQHDEPVLGYAANEIIEGEERDVETEDDRKEEKNDVLDNDAIGGSIDASNTLKTASQSPIAVPDPLTYGGIAPKVARYRGERYTRTMKLTAATNDSIETMELKYYHDTYSFIAVHGPTLKGYSLQRFLFFLFGFLPFVFQTTFLLLLIWSETNEMTGTIGETDNPDEGPGFMSFVASFIPANSSPIMRWTQITAMAAYVIFPDSSLQDIVRAIRFFPHSSKIQNGEPVGNKRLACILRGIQGILAMSVTFLLIMTSETVVDIILNFTAVNFISALDDYAFSLAISGEFGPTLQAEARALSERELPPSMQREFSSKYKYNLIVLSTILVFLFGLITFVLVAQDDNSVWITKALRVQFQGGTGLNPYSGCFELDSDRDSISFSRRAYFGAGNTSLAYCREHRQWILFSSEDFDNPCFARNNNEELARSANTDAYDITASFDGQWVTSTNTPVDLFFFESGDKENLFCDLTLGDGLCDEDLNKMGFVYDDGDCCSATCNGPNCGTGSDVEVFHQSSSSFSDFPHCINPEMVPITIRLDGIKTSRDEEFVPMEAILALPFYERPFESDDPTKEIEWRSEVPVNPYLLLDCDDKTVLFSYIDESMMNQYHTVKVADGANCTLKVQNSTAGKSFAKDEPVWFVNYTLFHGDTDDSSVEIRSQQSSRENEVVFKRIPECYFRDLIDYNYVDTESIYNAIDWLAVLDDETDKDTTQCGERFALFDIAFEMNASDVITKTQNQCRWPEIECKGEKVSRMDWSYKDLAGYLPNELMLLENLEVLKLNGNRISSISSEIGTMKRLKEIDLSSNVLSSIPTEIGSISSLRSLRLDDNMLPSLPSQIGRLVDLEELIFGANELQSDDIPTSTQTPSTLLTVDYKETVDNSSSVPTQIWQLSNLVKLSLYDNGLTSLPTEIGKMIKIRNLDLHDNELDSIPTEIGQLTNLEFLRLHKNKILSIPTEIQQLTKLKTIDLDINNVAIIPKEIVSLTDLEDLFFYNNKISLLPTEIGGLTSLKNLRLDQNSIKTIPTEIGNLTGLEILLMDANDVSSIPAEISELSNLKFLSLRSNALSSIPTDIRKLTSLEKLQLDTNNFSSIPAEIGQLTNLKTLRLERNRLSSIPTEIGQLASLQILDLENNELTSIPSEIGNLTNLQFLLVRDNYIRSLPSEISRLSNLRELSFGRNNITFSDYNSTDWLVDFCNTPGIRCKCCT